MLNVLAAVSDILALILMKLYVTVLQTIVRTEWNTTSSTGGQFWGVGEASVQQQAGYRCAEQTGDRWSPRA